MKTIASLALVLGFLICPVISLSAETASPGPAGANKDFKDYEKAYVDRIKKINARIRRKQIEAECKAEGKKTYSAIHFKQRRAFVRDCIANRL